MITEHKLDNVTGQYFDAGKAAPDYIDENRCMCKAVFDSCYRTHLRESWLSEIKELRRTIPITPARVDSLFFTKILTEKGSYCIGPCQLRVQ